MNAALLHFVAVFDRMFVGSSRSISFPIRPIPVDSLDCVVPSAIIARIWMRGSLIWLHQTELLILLLV